MTSFHPNTPANDNNKSLNICLPKHFIICADNMAAMAALSGNSTDACITDCPYGMDTRLAAWDTAPPSVHTWEAIYRVLKPGAFCVAYSTPKYYHRLATHIEAAGFNIVDMVVWINATKMTRFKGLKPAHEPICVAQKPMTENSINANVERWGVGAININKRTRVPWGENGPPKHYAGGPVHRKFGNRNGLQWNYLKQTEANPDGRYPSNVVGLFDDANIQKFFYAPRVSTKERAECNNDHPTPKPIDLMAWLVSLYCPQHGIVLDPFCGSGSTGVAALNEGRRFIGIDNNAHYINTATERLASAASEVCAANDNVRRSNLEEFL